MPKKADTAGLGTAVADEISRQHRDLALRNWPDIQRLLEDEENDGEIKLAFATTVTNRAAEEGTQSAKDSRIVTTLSFSLGKKSDKIESAFPDPNQLPLGT
jgi:hypothetical protein